MKEVTSYRDNDGMGGAKVNPKFKDKLFVTLFSDQQAMFELYKELHPEDVTATVDDVRKVTLENILMNERYNDLGFTVGDKLMVFVEEQSSVCYNMPIRMFIYAASTYNNYLLENKIFIHRKRLINLPKPEFYVISTQNFNTRELRLSDAFGGDNAFMELKVRVIEKDEAEDRLPSVDTYLEFVELVAEYFTLYKDWTKAVNSALDSMETENTRVWDLIQERRIEVTNLFEMNLTDEEFRKLELEDAKEEAREEGREEGREESIRDAITNLKAKGKSDDEILDILVMIGQEREKIKEYL